MTEKLDIWDSAAKFGGVVAGCILGSVFAPAALSVLIDDWIAEQLAANPVALVFSCVLAALAGAGIACSIAIPVLKRRNAKSAKRIKELETERNAATDRAVDPKRFAAFEEWERETSEFMAMPRDRKQLILEMIDGEQHRIADDDRRRRNAAEILWGDRYIDLIDNDGSGSVYQINAATRVKLKVRADEWKSALEDDALPDDSIFSDETALEYDPPCSSMFPPIINPVFQDPWFKQERG